MIKKAIIICAMTLPLAACWNPFASLENPINKQVLADTEASYGAALAISVGYRDACNKKLIARSCRDIVKQIQNADNYAYAQIQVARDFVKNNPTIDATVVITTAKQAVQAFKDAETANGVN